MAKSTIAVLVALMFIAPFAWTLGGALKPEPELNAIPPTYVTTHPTFANFRELAGTGPGIVNSVIVTVGTVTIVSLLSILAGYGFACFRFRGSGGLFLLLLATLMIPFQSILIPLFIVLKSLHLIDSLFGLVLVYATFELPFALFIMRNSFSTIPPSLEEAALLDGAGVFSSLRHVLAPLALPGIVTVILYSFFVSWSEFLAALTFLTNGSHYTLPIMLVNLNFAYLGVVHWGVLQAGVIVSILPCIAIFLLLQRYYISGMTGGAIKG